MFTGMVPDAAGTAHQGVELLGALHGDSEATAVEPAGPDALGDSDHSSRPGVLALAPRALAPISDVRT